jgi:hypothetical protein
VFAASKLPVTERYVGIPRTGAVEGRRQSRPYCPVGVAVKAWICSLRGDIRIVFSILLNRLFRR